MENLMFALNSTMPIFILMIAGAVFRKVGWMDEDFAVKVTKFVFQVSLPVMVFKDLATVNFNEMFDLKFLLFCFAVTILSILISIGISYLWKDRSIQGEFIQATYRSSAALLGIAFITNIYGTSGMAPLMIIGSVPLYNIMAVVVLSLYNPANTNGIDSAVIKRTLHGIVTNPIIIAILLGIIWSLLGLPLSGIPAKAVSNLAATASPMGIVAMGATLDMQKALGKIKPAIVASVIKLVGFGAIFFPIAVMMGFKNEQMVAICVLLGSATATNCFAMAKNMGHEGTLTSSCVMITTLLAAVTLTFWLWLGSFLGVM